MRRRRALAAPLAVSLLAARVARAADRPVMGRLVQFSGGVVVLAAGEPRPASRDGSLFEGERVRTYGDGKALIVLDGGIRVTLGPASELEITRFVPAPPQGRFSALLRLLDGIVRVLIAEDGPGGALDVETSAATASARATEFLVQTSPERTSVLGIAREITVRGRGGGEVVLGLGQGTDVADDPAAWRRYRQGAAMAGPATTPAAAKTWGAARRDAALALTTL